MNKKIFILLFLFIALISMSAVSAADLDSSNDTIALSNDAETIAIANDVNAIDDLNENYSDGDGKALENDAKSVAADKNNENDLLSLGNDENGNILKAEEGNLNDLNMEIDNGKYSGYVTLEKDIYRYDGSWGNTIRVDMACTIDGNGAIIDMAGTNFLLFYIGTSGVTIKNLTIQNAYNPSEDPNDARGSAIYFTSFAAGSVENCTFVNNTAYGEGAAIYFGYKSGGSVKNCTFVNNAVKSSDSRGGAISNDQSTLEVRDCTFVNNSAERMGGAIYFHVNCDNSVLENSIFMDNAALIGSAAYFLDDISSFNDNWWGSNNPDWDDLTDDNVPSSYAVLNGAAITQTITPGSKTGLNYTFYSSETSELLFSLPKREITLSATGGNLDDTSGYLVNGEFSTEFSAEGIGEYIITATVDNQKINIPITVAPLTWYVNGSKSSSGNGKSEADAFVTLNEALMAASDGDIIKIASGTYSGNGNSGVSFQKLLTFEKYGDGEAIFDGNGQSTIWSVGANSINISGLTFKNGYGYWGGAIDFRNNVSNSVINATFINNTGIEYGGAIYVEGIVSKLTLNSTFINNTASIRGGGIFIKGVADNLSVYGEFRNNAADRYGGAISVGNQLSNSTINAKFINNTAGYGGAISGTKVSNSVINSTFENNVATGSGGAIYWFIVSDSLINSIFKNNSAERGGAIRFDGKFTKSNLTSVFINNIASADGGANCFNAVEYVNIIGDFINNTAKGSGGKCVGGANAFNYEMTNVSISGNFIGNSATGSDATDGGAANYFFKGISNVNITGKFINNTGNNVIYIFDSNSGNNYIQDSVFLNNDVNHIINVTNGEITAKDNWFGNNQTNYKVMPENVGIDLDNWLFLNYTIDTHELDVGDSSQISFILVSFDRSEVSDYDASKMNITLDLSQTLGELDKTSALMGEKITYTAKEGGDATVTGKFETASQTIRLTNNDPRIPTEIKIANSTVDLKANDEIESGATLTPAYAGNVTYTSSNSSVAVVVNGKIKALAAGSANITVSFAGNDTYAAAENKTITVNVSLNDASVSVNNDTLNLLVNGTFDLEATTVPSGLNVSYSSTNESVVTVNSEGKVTAVGAGNATIVVTVGDDKVYAINSTNVGVNVKIPTEIDNILIPELRVGNKFTLLYILVDSNTGSTIKEKLEYTVTSTNESVVKAYIDRGIVIECVGEGNANVTAGFAGNDKYAAAENKTFTLTVKKIPTEISVENSTVDMKANDEIDAGASLTPANAGNVTYTSSNSSVAIVENGKIKALAEGNATITVSFAGDYKYAAAENKTITVNVSLNDASVSVNNDTLNLLVNGTFDLEATTVPSGLNVSYSSTNESVVTVNSEGKVTAVGAGNATIVVTVGDDKVYAINSTNVSVNVKIPTEIDDILIPELRVGNKFTLHYILVDSNTGSTIKEKLEYTVTSTNESVVKAYIDNGIVIECVGEGNTNVTAGFAGNDKYAAAENKTFTLTVNKVPTEIKIANSTVNLKANDEIESGATLTPADAGNVTYTSSNSSVAVVENGKIKALAAGSANITVSFAGNDTYAAAENKTIVVNVALADASVSVNNDTLDLVVKGTFDLEATTVPSGLKVSYSSTNESVVTVNSDGKVTAVGAGNATIVVTVGDDKVYAINSTNVGVNVKIPTAIRDILIPEMWVGNIFDLPYLLVDSNTGWPIWDNLEYTVTSSNESVVKVYVDNGIVIECVGEGNANVTAGFAGNDKYAAAENKTFTLTVNKVPTEIKIANSTVDMKVKEEIESGATLNPTSAGNVTYTSSNSSVAIVKDDKIIAVGEGSANITVSFAGDNTYAAAENKTITVNVSLNEASLSVDNSTLDLFVGDDYTLTVNTSPAGLNVTFTPDNSGVVSVENGTITALKEGEGSVRVSVGGDGVYEFKSIDVTVTVKKIPTEISVANSTVDLKVNDEIDAGASLTPADAGNVTYTSSNSSVAVVENGKIKALAEGNATITVSFAGDNAYAAAENKTITVNVSLNDANLSVDNSTLDLFVGDDYTLTVNTSPEGLNVTFTPDNSGVVSVENGTITALKEGEGSVRVSVGGDGVYEFKSIDVTVTVKKIPTEISVENSTVDMKVNDEIESGASLTPADAGNVTYTSSNSSVAIVENGKIKALAEGNATITVSFAGDDTYATAENKTIAVNVSLNDANLSVDNSTLDLFVGDYYTLTVNTSPEGLNVTFTPDNSGVVSVDENGKVIALKEGEGSVRVSVGGDGVYEFKSIDVTVTVKKIPTEISVENSTVDMKVNDEIDAGASLTPADAGNVTYTSSNSSVVIVENGKIKALAEGNATITVSFAGDDKYVAAENKTIAVNVSLNDASLSVDNSTLDLFVGDDYILTVNTSPEGLNVTFTPDNSGVVSVDENGKVTALKEGEGSVRVSVGGDGVYEFKSIDVTVTVKKIPTEISVENSTVDMKVNDEIDAGASLTPADAGNVTYTSSNSSVAIVENGKIKALAEGNATITVSFAGDDTYATAENKTIEVTVNLRDASISVLNDTVSIVIDEIYQIDSIVVPENLTISYVSSNPEIASIDNGTIYGEKNGTAVITLTVGDGKVYKMVNATVTVTVSKVATEIILNNATLDMHVGDVASDVASLRPFLVDNVTYTSTNSSVVKVEDGKLVAVGNGSAIVIVSYAGDDKYAAAESKNVTVTVTKVETSISVDVDSVDMKVGDDGTINATLDPADAGELDYTSSDVSVVTVNGIGEITAVGNGTAVITISFFGDDKYAAAESKNVTVTVTKVETSISVDVDSVQMKVGDNAKINANVTPADAGELDYTSSDVSVVTVNGIGELIAVGDGTAVITVRLIGDEKYAPASKNVTVTVTKVETSIDVDADNVKMNVGDNAKINATLSPADIGELDYTSSDVSVVTVNGIGELTAVGDGTAVITVSFLGDEKYAPASKNVTVTVGKKASKFAEISVVKNNVTLILSDEDGNPISGANISYSVNGVSNTTVSDDNGSFVIVGEPGASIAVNYAGSNVYLASNITIQLTPMRQSTVIIGKNYTQYAVDYYAGERGQNFTVQLKDADGNVLANKTVLIGYNGKTLERTTDAKGYASVQINLKDKNRLTFAVTFLGDEKYNATMSVYLITIKQKPVTISAAAKTYKATAKTKKYTVTLKTIKGASVDGKTYFKSGKKVTMKLNGKTYTAKTNTKGQATFSLKITKKGKFTAVVKYAGDSTYKSASKKVKITIK